MQKKIIALAIAAALTSPALALADAPTVYGQANLSIDMAKDGVSGTSSSANQMVSNASRIGVKGSEDLGNGMTGVYQLEGTVAMDSGKGIALAFDRNTYVGVATSGGTIVLGQHDTPYKMATRNLDVFADDVAADNRNPNGIALMGDGILDARLPNVVAYISPSFSGLTVAAATMFGAETLPQPVAPANKKGTALSLAGMYTQGAIYASLAYQTIKFGDANTGYLGTAATELGGILGVAVDDKAAGFKLGGGYTVDQGSVGLVFEKITFTPGLAGSSSSSNTNIYLAGKFNVSATDAAKLAYGKKGDSTSGGVTTKDGATEIAFGYDHALSKATTVYALYAKVSQSATNSAAPSTISVGYKHSF